MAVSECNNVNDKSLALRYSRKQANYYYNNIYQSSIKKRSRHCVEFELLQGR